MNDTAYKFSDHKFKAWLAPGCWEVQESEWPDEFQLVENLRKPTVLQYTKSTFITSCHQYCDHVFIHKILIKSMSWAIVVLNKSLGKKS